MINVENPSDGTVIGQIPNQGKDEAIQAIARAEAAFARWRELSCQKRSEVLKEWHHRILEDKENLADIIMKEAGKPKAQALAEVEYAASFVAWFADEALCVRSEASDWPAKSIASEVRQEPVGVCYAITPWNFPAAMVTRKVAPALAAGCSVILKPSELTPYTAIRLADLLEEKDLLQVITGEPQPITEVMMESEMVRKISFTGSTRVGQMLMEQSAATLKRLSLELGGNAPFIIMRDADLDAAVEGLVYAKFRNSGQNCISPNRILVQADIEEAFIGKLLSAVDKLKKSLDYGPLINRVAVDKVQSLVAEAVKSGAEVLIPGGAQPGAGYWVAPVVLNKVTADMRVACEEIFGPVIAISSFQSADEAIERANDTPYGLAAYLYAGSDRSHELHYGMVGFNTTRISHAELPFGGVKHSGFGREGGKTGIEEYLETRLVCAAR